MLKPDKRTPDPFIFDPMIITIPFSQVAISPENARKKRENDAQQKELVASIKNQGLIQPLVVRSVLIVGDDGVRYHVIDGGRRFDALKSLGAVEVKVVVNTSDLSVKELSAAANMMRQDMHPLDECDAIHDILKDGESESEVASRFGRTERWVKQRSKLSNLIPPIKKFFRDGLIQGDVAEAFCAGTEEQQKTFLKEFPLDTQPGAYGPWKIKSIFSQKKIRAEEALFSLSEYPGDKTECDLFSEQVWLTDPELFRKMQTAHIDGVVTSVKEEGWDSVLYFANHEDAYKATKKYVKVEGRILKAARGKYVVLVIHNQGGGSLSVDRGYVLRSKAPAPDLDGTGTETVSAEEVKDLKSGDFSRSQKEAIGAMQTAALADLLEQGKDDVLALYVVLAGLMLGVPPTYVGTRTMPGSGYVKANLTLHEKLVPALAPDRMDLASFRMLTRSERATMLCKAAAASLSIMEEPMSAKDLSEVLGLRGWYTPDKGFIKKYRKDQLIDYADKVNIDTEKAADMKKDELVEAIYDASIGAEFVPGY